MIHDFPSEFFSKIELSQEGYFPKLSIATAAVMKISSRHRINVARRGRVSQVAFFTVTDT